MRDDGQPAPQTIRGLWQALALSAFVIVLLWDLTAWLDLSLTDDAAYSGRGARLAAGGWGELSLVRRPVYVAVYGFAHLLPVSWHAMDSMHVICLLGSTLALWWALRACVSPSVAMLAAGWWALLDVSLRSSGRLYVFDMMLWSLAGGFFLRSRHGPALLMMVLGVVDRGENLLMLMALALLATTLGRRAAVPVVARGLYCTAAITLAAVLLLSNVAHRYFWLAFSQHYAYGLAERSGGAVSIDGVDHDPWLHHEIIRRRTFPTSSSFTDAVVEDPVAVGTHVLRNASRIPDTVVSTFFRPLRRQRAVRTVLIAGLVLALIAAMLARRRSGEIGGNWLRARRRILVIAGMLALLPTQLVVYPRGALLAPFALPFALLVLAPFASPTPRSCSRRSFALVTAALLAVAWIVPDHALQRSRHPIVNRLAVRLLNAPATTGHVALLARNAGRMIEIAERFDLEPIELSRRSAPGPMSGAEVASLIELHDLRLAMVDDRDPVAVAARSALAEAGFQVVATDPPFTLLVRQ